MISVACFLFAACEQPGASVPEDPVTPPVEEPTDKGYVYYNYAGKEFQGSLGETKYTIMIDNVSNGVSESYDDFYAFKRDTYCGSSGYTGRLILNGTYTRYPMDEEHEQIIPYTIEYTYRLSTVSQEKGNGDTWGIVYGKGIPTRESERYTIRTENGNYYVYNRINTAGVVDLERETNGVLDEPEEGSFLSDSTRLTEAEIKEIVTLTYDSDLVIRATFDGGFVMQPILVGDELTGFSATLLEVEPEWKGLKLAQTPVAIGTWNRVM